MFGRKMQQAKVGGKSFNEDQDFRRKEYREIEKRLAKHNPEAAKTRKLRQLGVTGADEKIDLSKIDKIADERQDNQLKLINEAREKLPGGNPAELYKTEIGRDIINKDFIGSDEFTRRLMEDAKRQFPNDTDKQRQ